MVSMAWDHVLASGDEYYLLVMDTEVIPIPGGHLPKLPDAAIAKFAAAGKKIRKKRLGMMAISYGDVL
jgi:pyruvate-ferredoxin/flavodoxin oxidoreductase